MKPRPAGMTLLEMLIVVGIIAILAAIAVPNLLIARTRAKVTQAKAESRQFATALESYFADWNAYPPTFLFGGGGGGPSPNQLAGSIDIVPLESGFLPLCAPVAYMDKSVKEEPFNQKQGWLLYEGWDVLDQGGPPPDAANRKALYLYLGMPPESVIGNPLVLSFVQSALYQYGPALTPQEAQAMMRSGWFLVSPGPDGSFSFDRCMIDTGYNPGSSMDCLFEQISDIGIPRFGGIYDPTNGTVSRGEIVRCGRPVNESSY